MMKSLYNPGNDTRIKDRLYQCTPENYPELTENLYITGCHSILLDQLTEQQTMDTLRVITDDKYRLMSHLDVRSVPYTCEGNYTIYHVTLEHDEYMNYGIWANGLLVDSCSRKSMEEKGQEKDKGLGDQSNVKKCCFLAFFAFLAFFCVFCVFLRF